MQFALNKKTGTLHYNTLHSLNQRAIQAVWLYIQCLTIQLYISSASKRKSDIHTPTPIHSQSLEIPNHEEEGALKQKISMLG